MLHYRYQVKPHTRITEVWDLHLLLPTRYRWVWLSFIIWLWDSIRKEHATFDKIIFVHSKSNTATVDIRSLSTFPFGASTDEPLWKLLRCRVVYVFTQTWLCAGKYKCVVSWNLVLIQHVSTLCASWNFARGSKFSLHNISWKFGGGGRGCLSMRRFHLRNY
jgi:hypothetical protein